MTFPTIPNSKKDEQSQLMSIIQSNTTLFMLTGWCMGLVSYPVVQRILDSFVLGGQRFNSILYDLVPETVGILFTVLILERFANRREAAREQEEIKQRIIREMSTRDNATARRAAREARERGLLEDGSLRQALLPEAKMEEVNLTGADLYGAMLWEADLSRAKLSRVILRDASLEHAQLDEAYLYRADLRNAFLQEADLDSAMLDECNLQGAKLQDANLENAEMHHVNLRGAFMVGANLVGANLDHAEYDENTILPDAKRMGRDADGNFIYDSHWSNETDMKRFTDPKHRDFWKPEYLERGFKGREPYWKQKKTIQMATRTALFLSNDLD